MTPEGKIVSTLHFYFTVLLFRPKITIYNVKLNHAGINIHLGTLIEYTDLQSHFRSANYTADKVQIKYFSQN